MKVYKVVQCQCSPDLEISDATPLLSSLVKANKIMKELEAERHKKNNGITYIVETIEVE